MGEFILILPNFFSEHPAANGDVFDRRIAFPPSTPVLPTARKFGQITQNSPNFKPRGREKFGPSLLFSQILAENSPRIIKDQS